MTNMDLYISIQDVAETVENELGWEVVQNVYKNHGAKGIDDLDPSEYEAVFSELYFYEADLRN